MLNVTGRELQKLDQKSLHLRLNELNHYRLTPALPCGDYQAELKSVSPLLLIEETFLEQLRREAAPVLADMPERLEDFMQWFEALKESGPGQNDRLFPWLASTASMEEMKWFLTQEVAGEAGFEDLTALTQVRLPGRPKLEMARNYWDEMGRGNPKGMHGPLLQAISDKLALSRDPTTTVWEALALANAMAGMACNRRYAYHSVGALGIVELTAPGRAAMVNAGLKRLGLAPDDRHYFSLHSVLDIQHSKSWNAEVIEPLVKDDPAVARAIAEGAVIRLQRGAACFQRYREVLGVS